MITLKKETSEAIRIEMESIPEKYQKPFNSFHEAIAVIREEYIELEQEVFFGEKKHQKRALEVFHGSKVSWGIGEKTSELYKKACKKEAIKLAAMCCRLIQELT